MRSLAQPKVLPLRAAHGREGNEQAGFIRTCADVAADDGVAFAFAFALPMLGDLARTPFRLAFAAASPAGAMDEETRSDAGSAGRSAPLTSCSAPDVSGGKVSGVGLERSHCAPATPLAGTWESAAGSAASEAGAILGAVEAALAPWLRDVLAFRGESCLARLCGFGSSYGLGRGLQRDKWSSALGRAAVCDTG